MTRIRFMWCVASTSFALAVVLATADVQSAPRLAPAAAAQAQSPAAPVPAAEYIGSDTCLGCHEGMDTALAKTMHGRAAHPKSPAAAQGCESCHGPGSRHIEDPSDDTGIRKFSKMAPRDTAAASLVEPMCCWMSRERPASPTMSPCWLVTATFQVRHQPGCRLPYRCSSS